MEGERSPSPERGPSSVRPPPSNVPAAPPPVQPLTSHYLLSPHGALPTAPRSLSLLLRVPLLLPQAPPPLPWTQPLCTLPPPPRLAQRHWLSCRLLDIPAASPPWPPPAPRGLLPLSLRRHRSKVFRPSHSARRSSLLRLTGKTHLNAAVRQRTLRTHLISLCST